MMKTTCLFESNSKACDSVVVRTSLKSWKDSSIDFVLIVIENLHTIGWIRKSNSTHTRPVKLQKPNERKIAARKKTNYSRTSLTAYS